MAQVSHHPLYTWTNLQYLLLGVLLLVDLCVIQSPPVVVRLLLAGLLIAAAVAPYTRRFFWPALPIFGWLITYFACQFIPEDYRPRHIFVNILPTLERILYGANLSEILSKHTHPVLDVLAWLPYGVIHFSLPFVFSLLLFVFGPPGSLPVFGHAFGYMNLAGVMTQLLFPNASPWYELSYGSAPADYAIPGEAGGLARIDQILGLNLYSSSFGASPLVFGAFPSLHSGSATLEMAFVTYLCPKLWPLGIGYTMWMWWSTMYLTHHYLIDLVGGSIYALSTYFIARRYLPAKRPNAKTRLDYLGIPFSIGNLFRSIEFDRNFPQLADTCNAVTKPKEGSLLHATVIDMDDQDQDDLVSVEPKCTEDGVSLRLRRPEDLVSVVSSGTSSPVEPSSPVTPRTSSFGHFPFKDEHGH